MKITITPASGFVDDQAKALDSYPGTLGFVKNTDVPAGELRQRTVVGRDAQNIVELLIDPDDHPAVLNDTGGNLIQIASMP